jgi:hypothetical protein
MCMLLQIQIASEGNASELLFNVAPNSWVHKSQGHRTFFADGLAYLPSETPAALQEWRQAELDEMKVREWTSVFGVCGEPPCAGHLSAQLECTAVYDASAECNWASSAQARQHFGTAHRQVVSRLGCCVMVMVSGAVGAVWSLGPCCTALGKRHTGTTTTVCGHTMCHGKTGCFDCPVPAAYGQALHKLRPLPTANPVMT